MTNFVGKISRARWFAGRERYGEAVAALGSHPPDGVTAEELVWYFGLRGTMRIPTSDSNQESAMADLNQALELGTFHKLPDDTFVWLTRYNLGLATILANRPRIGETQQSCEQRQGLEHAVSMLGVTAEALRPVSTRLYARSGVALALVAEALHMMGRVSEALFYAEEAIYRLRPHDANALNSRRLLGCYGIFRQCSPGWQHPPGSTGYINSPGVIGTDEIDAYQCLPELAAAPAT